VDKTWSISWNNFYSVQRRASITLLENPGEVGAASPALALPQGAVSEHVFSFYKNRTEQFTSATLCTSVLNDLSFTTHDLLRVLRQASPYSGIFT
jgi:hypothetical protein